MKVVLFCGGLGTRLREYSDTVPKPLVPIGYRPILWHLMKYYAHYGHTDFILCLGHRADLIKEFFLNYNQAISSTVSVRAGNQIELMEDVENWNVLLVDTGINASIGERLRAVEPYLEGDEMFLANYSDALSDLPLDEFVDDFKASDVTAKFLSVRPSQSFHCVSTAPDGYVRKIYRVQQSDIWINGGYFAFRNDIFDYMRSHEDLVEEPFRRLIKARRLRSEKHHGFWASMDTYKDKVAFDTMYADGDTPWMVWRNVAPAVVAEPPVRVVHQA